MHLILLYFKEHLFVLTSHNLYRILPLIWEIRWENYLEVEIAKRIKTNYLGVYYREEKRLGGPGKEKVYYVRFYKDDRPFEEKVGRHLILPVGWIILNAQVSITLSFGGTE